MGRGLEPAGVDLRARGFKEYLANLQRVEKQQRDTFDREFIGLERSYDKVIRAAKDYERQLNRTRQAQEKLARANELNRSLAQLSARQQQLSGFQLPGGLGGLAGGLGAVGAVGAVAALAKATRDASRESAIAAANFNAQVIGINNLAAAYGQSGAAIRNAMRQASQGVLSESAIIQGANQALLLGVAKTPEQFSEITRTALILGRTMGLEATQAIEQFNTALGRKSLLILDNFGISSKAVNAELDKLAQQRFGETASSLTQVQRDSLFVEAALKVAGQAADAIGDDAIAAAGDFDRLTASAENLKIAFGEVTLPLEAGLAKVRADLNTTLAQMLVLVDAGLRGFDDFFIGIGRAIEKLPDFKDILEPGAFDEFFEFLNEPLSEQAPDLFEDVRDRLKELTSTVFGTSFGEEELTDKVEDNTEALEDNEDQIKALQNAIRQAEQLELSFARAAEDAARKQGRQVAKLNRDQFKERQKFLNNQAKEFDDFNKDQAEAVAEAEKDLAKAREQANKERVREQDKLFRELRQAQERYDLDRIQSQRRFNLDETRLRAEGDILGLQRLREDFDLEQQEQAENFDLQQRQRKDDAKDKEQQQDEQRQERVQAAEQELKDLQNSFAEKQAEFLKQQDEEFQALLQSQAEQREALQESFREQEEDRLISQARQLEDLGRSLVDQENITREGATAIAQQLEEAFGVEGVADQIMSGFTARQESAFQKLFESITEGAKTTKEQLEELSGTGGTGVFGATGFESDPVSPLRVAGFQHGGSFEVGGTGGADSQLVAFRATPGERVTVTPQSQTFKMPIAAPSQLNVSFGGRSQIDVTGLEGASQATIDAAIEQMIQIQDIAIRRILRRHGVN